MTRDAAIRRAYQCRDFWRFEEFAWYMAAHFGGIWQAKRQLSRILGIPVVEVERFMEEVEACSRRRAGA